MNQLELRRQVLANFGSNAAEIAELLAYNHNVFEHCNAQKLSELPLSPEPHIAAWEDYATTAKVIGVFEALKQRLVQLQFPIQSGISQTPGYLYATRTGVLADSTTASGLQLQQPEQLQLIMHQSLAGVIPVLLTENREDFVALVQALTQRNEPKPIPASMGACMVANFNNWDRIQRYRQQWTAQNPHSGDRTSWATEFQRLICQKELYQDRFIILSDGPYSDVPANALRLSESEWRRLSLTIRLEHECTHYFTRRLFNSMRNNLLDELIADYRGIVAATGQYRSDWFLHFIGLESSDYREGGRLQNYRGQPPLSTGAFKLLQALVRAAAENLQRFDTDNAQELSTLKGQVLMLVTLTALTLEELAAPEANACLQKTMNQVRLMNCRALN